MRTGLIVAGLTLLVVAALWMMPPDPSHHAPASLTDLPWQIEPLADGSSRVLGLHLGEATLDDAIRVYGTPESMALFVAADGKRSLETYFGTVHQGPLAAKLIVALAADEARLDALAANATGRKHTESGDIQLLLDEHDKAALAEAPLQGITYIPTSSGLEAAFFRERLGEPRSWKRENEHAVSWFYPDLGLALLIDDEGREAFEYQPPRDFVVPPDAVQGQP